MRDMHGLSRGQTLKIILRRFLFSSRLKECLGSGHFGVVYRGLLQLSGEAGAGIKEVAVKTIESGASEEDKVKFLQEAAIMGQFNNPYIVAIYGVLTSRQPVRLPQLLAETRVRSRGYPTTL